ncbi:hypothetical protein GWL_11180 [Herbaspirillum sp. GW103]|nr:hypothetical protein GWL_11180 [Herbaspirillum sp. GW103]
MYSRRKKNISFCSANAISGFHPLIAPNKLEIHIPKELLIISSKCAIFFMDSNLLKI